MEVLRERATQHPERQAFIFLNDDGEPVESCTYGEVDRRARAVGALLQQNLKPGDRVLLVYPPSLSFAIAFLGCLYAGVVAVPIYPPDPLRLERTLPRFVAITQDANPKVACTLSNLIPIVQGLALQAPEINGLKWLATDTMEDSLEEVWKDPNVGSDTIAFFQYTSGSTSKPRGVILSHQNLIYNQILMENAFENTVNMVALNWLPLYHDMGLIGTMIQPLYVSGVSYLMSPFSFLRHPFVWLRAISTYKSNIAGGPNFAYDLCARKIKSEQLEQLDLSCWKVAFNGSEPVRLETLETFSRTFEPAHFDRRAFFPCYGLAEATLIVSGGKKGKFPTTLNIDKSVLLKDHRIMEAPAGSESSQTMVSCGSPLGDTRVVIVDPSTLAPVPEGCEGEIWISGTTVAQGYFNKPEMTQETFVATPANSTEGPFLRTSDLGVMFGGELYVTGRLKDIINIRGLKYYPHDIERTIERCHPSLRPGCTAAFMAEQQGKSGLVVVVEVERRVLSDRRAQTSGAWNEKDRRQKVTRRELDALPLVPEKGFPFDPQDVIQTIRKAIGVEYDLKVQDVLLLVPGTIPKTSSGKVQRHVCRNDYLKGTLQTIDKDINRQPE